MAACERQSVSALITAPHDTVFAAGEGARAVSVIVPLHNYRRYIAEALDSVMAQTCRDIELVVVDDASTDASLAVARAWMERHAGGDLKLLLLAHRANADAAITRNTGIAAASGACCFFLDADNLLYPRCIARHLAALSARPDMMAAYAMIEVFGAEPALMGGNAFARERLARGNYIDTMAMVRRDWLMAAGGFAAIPHGWEDYDLWLRLCEAEGEAIMIPEILSRYRYHYASKERTRNFREEHNRRMRAEIQRRHTWVELPG